MLRSLKELIGYELLAKDGLMGKTHDFLFSDEDWQVHYLIVDTGPWILGRKVLVSLLALGQPVWASETFPVDLTREQVKTSPDVDLARPVSRQYEEKLHQHYNWPAYWGMATAIPGRPAHIFSQDFSVQDEEENSHLRSAKELFGYKLKATDGDIGKLTDFIVEDDNWQFRYIIVNTNALSDDGNQVLVSLEWINKIDVTLKEISIDLTQQAIALSPEFNPKKPVNHQYEEVLYDYYGRPKY
ncbi:MAG: hypothetical protein PVJ21_03430 [Anaerolineales bacterium]|jgi:hypothetical protein